MTDLETRLRSLQRPMDDGPTPEGLRERAARRRRHRQLQKLAAGSLTAVLLAAAVAATWSLQPSKRTETVTTPAGDPADGSTPNTTIGDIGDVLVDVSPRTGLENGDLVKVQVDSVGQLPPSSYMFQCAGDVTADDGLRACDLGAIQQPGAGRLALIPPSEQETVSVDRTIHITRGSQDPNVARPYDCATEPAGCALAIAPLEEPLRAVLVPLAFEDTEKPTPTASITPAGELRDNQELTLTAEGLRPNGTFAVVLCTIKDLELGRNGDCDAFDRHAREHVEADANGSLTTTVTVRAAVHRHQGRVDCTIETCAVGVVGATGTAETRVSLSFAAGVEAPVPDLRLDPPGPYEDDQTVTVHGSGFPAGYDVSTNLGLCPADGATNITEICDHFWHAGERELVVDADGEFTATVQLSQPGSSGDICPQQCIVAVVVPTGPGIGPTIAASDPFELASPEVRSG